MGGIYVGRSSHSVHSRTLRSEKDGLLDFTLNVHGFLINISDLLFQVIIPASWIFALIINIPEFLVLDFKKVIASCILAWTEEWMGKAYSMLCFLVFGLLPIPLMVALYSKVVYSLWFKRNDDNELSHKQMVPTFIRYCVARRISNSPTVIFRV